jgi:hypothetical protein
MPAGEDLRAHTKPSVTDLLVRRAETAASTPESPGAGYRNFTAATDISLALARWDPPSATPVLLRRMREMNQVPQKGSFSAHHPEELARALARCGSVEGWAQLSEWLRSGHYAENRIDEDMFSALQEGLKNAEFSKTIEWLFNAPDGPWRDVVTGQARPSLELLGASSLADSKAFLRQAQRGLESKINVGDLVRREPGTNGSEAGGFHRNIGDQQDWMEIGKIDGSMPPVEQKVSFRECDYYAWLLAKRHEGREFQLYWPEERRDKEIKFWRHEVRVRLVAADTGR